MSKDNIIRPYGKWAAGAGLLAVALSAGALGLVLNVAHGLEAGLAAGIAFGLADGAKVLIPLAAGLAGWTRQLKLTAAVCVAVSLWSAVNVYMDGAGAAFLSKQHGAEAYASQAKAIGELEAEIKRLDAAADEEAHSCKAAKAKCRGPVWQKLNDQAETARARLQAAREARTAAKPVEVSGLAGLIAAASGAGADGIARGIGAVKAGLFLVLIEALVWLSVPGMALLRAQAAIAPERPATPVTAIATLSQALATPPKAGTRDWYLQRLRANHPALAKRIDAGELSVYAASVQAGYRKPPAKRNKWTKVDAYLEPIKA